MANRSHTIQKTREIYQYIVEKDTQIEATLELAPNEFKDIKDSIGLFLSDPEPYNSLSVEKEKVVKRNIKYSNEDHSIAEIIIQLSNKKHLAERS